MNTEKVLKHQELTARIIRVFFEVYNELGFGFLESVYAEALASAFKEAGLTVEREMPLEVRLRGRVVGQFRADLVVGGPFWLRPSLSLPAPHPQRSGLELSPGHGSGGRITTQFRSSPRHQTSCIRQLQKRPPRERLFGRGASEIRITTDRSIPVRVDLRLVFLLLHTTEPHSLS